MTIPFRSVVGFVHVKNMPVSIAFYEKIGFQVRSTVPPSSEEPVWAWLDSGGGSLMIAKADGPFSTDQQAVFFYLYVDDVAAKHAELLAAGVAADRITYPFYNARGEFRVMDPDGYLLMITHT